MDANLYEEGSIYYYENQTNTKKDYENQSLNHDFLVSRPVYVLRSNPTPFQTFTINVLEITSSMERPGISINIDGNRPGKILPYYTYSVHPEYLKEYMGKASESIISEVNSAYAYHNCFSTEKPQYLVEYETREKQLIDAYKKMTLYEKTLYHFFRKQCSIKPEYFVTQAELLVAYNAFAGKYAYERTADFTKAMGKILVFFPTIERQRESGSSYIYYGLGLNQLLHDITSPAKSVVTKKSHHVKGKRHSRKGGKHACAANEKLYDTISPRAAEEYNRMDIIEKINGYRKTINHLDIPRCPKEDLPVIKQMIENEVDQLKEKIFRMLDNGENPLNMPSSYQFLLHNCTNREMLEHIQHRYIQKAGGFQKFRKTLRSNVKHYFVRLHI